MPPRPKKPSTTVSNKLLEAVIFLSAITKSEGAPFETHILLQNRTATAFNGILAAGQLIEEDLIAAPHNETFLDALKRCGEQFSITQLDSGKLSIKSGKFRALVQCMDPSLLSFPIPDNPCAVIDDRLKEALAVLEVIKTDNAQRVVTQSFLLNGQSIIATDSKIIMECWHGINLPTNLAIPKALIPAITKCNKKLSQFGFSRNSITFYFEDNSWIRSQLYAEEWPTAVHHLLNKECHLVEIPKGFYEAIDAVEPFTDNATVYFNKDLLQSHHDKEKGATYEVPGLIEGPAYAVRYLDILKPYAEKIDFCVPAENRGYLLVFYGKNVRGIVAGVGR